MNVHETINYVEFPSKNIDITKAFFSTVFGWTFTDYGSEYSAVSTNQIDVGFFKSDLACSSAPGGALIVFYSENLEETQKKIEDASGVILKSVFDFPGGRRCHFCDPNGNEYALWSDKEKEDSL